MTCGWHSIVPAPVPNRFPNRFPNRRGTAPMAQHRSRFQFNMHCYQRRKGTTPPLSRRISYSRDIINCLRAPLSPSLSLLLFSFSLPSGCSSEPRILSPRDVPSRFHSLSDTVVKIRVSTTCHTISGSTMRGRVDSKLGHASSHFALTSRGITRN